jgi:hypothetical protein
MPIQIWPIPISHLPIPIYRHRPNISANRYIGPTLVDLLLSGPDLLMSGSCSKWPRWAANSWLGLGARCLFWYHTSDGGCLMSYQFWTSDAKARHTRFCKVMAVQSCRSFWMCWGGVWWPKSAGWWLSGAKFSPLLTAFFSLSFLPQLLFSQKGLS